jgi:hypothetical protein
MKKSPSVAPGINYQDKWENATNEDRKKGNVTKVTNLIYDEYDPINRRNYHDENK